MNDTPPAATTTPTGFQTPSRRRVLTTLLVTVVAAAVILVLVVLPAEYGIDPTGAGAALGLDRLNPTGPVTQPMELAPADAAVAQKGPWDTLDATIDIAAREEVEFKLSMTERSAVVFEWQTDGGELYVDFHAHPFNDLDGDEIRYDEQPAASTGYGSINAPFSGYHGWYWRNDSEQPVQIALKVAGYFIELKEHHRAPLD